MIVGGEEEVMQVHSEKRTIQPSETLVGLGLRKRLARLFNQESENALVIGLDHGLWTGTLPGIERLDSIANLCADSGADALQVGPGAARWISPSLLEHPEVSLVLRLDRNDAFSPADTGGTRGALVASVADSIRAGADAAVVFYVEGGASTADEDANVARVSRAAAEARDLGVPLMVEALATGGAAETIAEPEVVGRVSRVAFELGADILKIDHPGDEGALQGIVESVDVPVLLRGGPRTDDFRGLLGAIERAINLGVRGVVLGRNVWQAENPLSALKDFASAVHGMDASTLESAKDGSVERKPTLAGRESGTLKEF